MKFSLAENLRTKFSHEINGATGKCGHFPMTYSTVECKDQFDNILSEMLKQMVAIYCEIPDKRDIIVSIVSEKLSNVGSLRLCEKGSFLKDIKRIFGGENVHLKVTLLHQNYRHIFDSIEMPVHDDLEKTCEQNGFQFSEDNKKLMEMFQNDSPSSFCITVKVDINVKKTLNFGMQTSNQYGLNLNKKILLNGIHSDAVITASNGGQIKCHKSVLSACSSVFETIFKAEKEASGAINIDMSDMTEDGVKAFLAYMYCQDESEPSYNPGIAFQLLSAGQKYNVLDLQTSMHEVFLSKPAEWYDVNFAIKIFLLARILEDGEDLKKKAVGVLKEKSKTLKESETYKEMFHKNPEAGMEFCLLALQID